QDDPAWGWVLPNTKRRAALLPWLFQTGFEIADAQVWTTDGDLLGVARWMPPGKPDVHVGAMLRALIATPLRVREATTRCFADGRLGGGWGGRGGAGGGRPGRGRRGPGAGPGAAPPFQRRGVGGPLLEPGLAAAAAAGLPCALLTNSERNLPFYTHHGFEVVR